MLSATQVGPDFELMRRLETAVARNLVDYVAAYRQVAPQTDAKSIDVMAGVAAFTGIDSPLTTVKGTAAHISTRDLRQVESFFGDHKAPTVTIEMAPWLSEESKQLLGERGYIAADHENLVATLSGTPLTRRTPRAEPIPMHAWPELLHRGFELPDDSASNELVTAAAHLPHAQLHGVRENDRWIACAQSVTYDDVVIMWPDPVRLVHLL